MSDPRSRKRGEASDDTEASRSTSLVERLIENIQLEEALNPKLTLKRFLSIRTVVSTSSSFAERQRVAVGTRSRYRSIGSGTCGKVFEIPGTADIFKVARYPNKETDQIWNDYQMHARVSEAFEQIGRANLDVHVPILKYYVSSKDDEFWSQNLARFPPEDQQNSSLLCAEHIPPLAKPIRESLIDQYCAAAHRQHMKASPSNKDCLVRLYLGKRRERAVSKFFQLRNFTLYLDQMEELELNIQELAVAIANALAIMHWKVHIDANDVEFVLGSAPKRIATPELIIPKAWKASEIQNLPPNTSTWAGHVDDFKGRATHIWLLDFNRCADFSPTESGLEQLVHSFFINDPYFPRPLATPAKDEQLWTLFKSTYIAMSSTLVSSEHSELPSRFMDMVVETQRKKMEARSSTV